jgi:hypothetical protein
LDNELFLFFDNLADPGVIDSWMDMTLHHGTSLVIFDITFPSLWTHSTIFTETLFTEITQSQIIGIGHQILYFSSLHLFYIINFFYILIYSLDVFHNL